MGADHERMGSHWLSIYQRAICLLSYRVRSCKSWWIFQQSWCLFFLWSRVLWTTLNIIESNKNRYDMIWYDMTMVLASRKTRGHFHGFVCFSKPAQDALVLLQRVKDEGKLSVFLFSRTISACTKADGSGFHRMSTRINTKQLSLKLGTCSFNMFQCI